MSVAYSDAMHCVQFFAFSLLVIPLRCYSKAKALVPGASNKLGGIMMGE